MFFFHLFKMPSLTGYKKKLNIVTDLAKYGPKANWRLFSFYPGMFPTCNIYNYYVHNIFLINFKLVNTNMKYSSIIISTSFIFSNLWLCRRPFHKCTINKICQVPAWSFHMNYVLWKTVLIQILYLTDYSGLNTWFNHAGFEFPWNVRAALYINFS